MTPALRAATLMLSILTAAAVPSVAEDQTMLSVGQPFVDFELPAHDGTTVSSAGLAGRPYLLFYYPKAGTPGWRVEATRLRDSWAELQDLGIAVVGVSYDSPEKNREFAVMNDLPFPLLSDRDRELARAVGAARALLPMPKRISYLVGPDGRILKTYPNVDPKTHAADVVADYRAMITGGESSDS